MCDARQIPALRPFLSLRLPHAIKVTRALAMDASSRSIQKFYSKPRRGPGGDHPNIDICDNCHAFLSPAQSFYVSILITVPEELVWPGACRGDASGARGKRASPRAGIARCQSLLDQTPGRDGRDERQDGGQIWCFKRAIQFLGNGRTIYFKRTGERQPDNAGVSTLADLSCPRWKRGESYPEVTIGA